MASYKLRLCWSLVRQSLSPKLLATEPKPRTSDRICWPSPPAASVRAVQRPDIELGGLLLSVRRRDWPQHFSSLFLFQTGVLSPWGPWEAGELCSAARRPELPAGDRGERAPAHMFLLHCTSPGQPGMQLLQPAACWQEDNVDVQH